jgi:hypothetical protein
MHDCQHYSKLFGCNQRWVKKTIGSEPSLRTIGLVCPCSPLGQTDYIIIRMRHDSSEIGRASTPLLWLSWKSPTALSVFLILKLESLTQIHLMTLKVKIRKIFRGRDRHGFSEKPVPGIPATPQKPVPGGEPVVLHVCTFSTEVCTLCVYAKSVPYNMVYSYHSIGMNIINKHIYIDISWYRNILNLNLNISLARHTCRLVKVRGPPHGEGSRLNPAAWNLPVNKFHMFPNIIWYNCNIPILWAYRSNLRWDMRHESQVS